MAKLNVRFIPKKTAVPNRVPTGTTIDEPSYIKQGELAINTADKKLYSFDGTDVFEIGENSFLNLTGGTINGGLTATTFYGNGSGLTNISTSALTDQYWYAGDGLEGIETISATSIGNYAVAEGYETIASGHYSHSEGVSTIAIGESSHAEGYLTTADGRYTHAEGEETTSLGRGSHSEGVGTIASGDSSHAEGSLTTANGSSSHAEGENTIANGVRSHAEGNYTTASGDYSHAEGGLTIANGQFSHSQNYYTNAASYAETAIGRYNYTGDSATTDSWVDTEQLFVVGNGTGSTYLNNAFAVYKNGNAVVDGNLTATTIFSGNTNLYDIFQVQGTDLEKTYVQNGLNTYTGGTEDFPTINISSATLNDLIVTGDTTLNTLTANTISATTYYGSGAYLDDVLSAQTDSTLNAVKVIEQVPLKSQQSNKELLVSAQDLTGSYADFGDEIDMDGHNRLGLYIAADCNDSGDVYLKVLGKYEYGGTDEFEIDGSGETLLWSSTATTDFNKYIEFDCGTLPYIQLQAYATTVGSTAGDLTININKKLIL